MRNQSIDLLRIVLMIMVVAFHTVSFGNLNHHHPVTPTDTNFFQSHFLASFTVMAVNCFVMLYITGDFIRRIYQGGDIHARIRTLLKRAALPGFMVCSLLTFLINIAWVFRGREDGIQEPFYGYNILTVYLAAVCLLACFLNSNVSNPILGSLIRFAAPLAFPVYLIHEQPNIRTCIYEWFAWYENDSTFWLVFVPLSSTLIFISCAAIEKLRRLLFGKIDSAIAGFAIRSHTWLKNLLPKPSQTP